MATARAKPVMLLALLGELGIAAEAVLVNNSGFRPTGSMSGSPIRACSITFWFRARIDGKSGLARRHAARRDRGPR